MGKQVKVGLALGSGAMRGLAHIGVLQALEEADIQIQFITGCSMGAVVGASYACGNKPAELSSLATKLTHAPFIELSFPQMGLLRGNNAESIIKKLTREMNFEQTRIPFAAIACDLENGELAVLKDGPVYKAVRASISIPGLYSPVMIGNRLLVDGGVMQRVPIKACRDLGAEFVIGCDVGYRGGKRKRAGNGYELVIQTLELMSWESAKNQLNMADVMLTPDVQQVDPFFIHHPQACIDIGYKHTKAMLSDIKNKMQEIHKTL